MQNCSERTVMTSRRMPSNIYDCCMCFYFKTVLHTRSVMNPDPRLEWRIIPVAHSDLQRRPKQTRIGVATGEYPLPLPFFSSPFPSHPPFSFLPLAPSPFPSFLPFTVTHPCPSLPRTPPFSLEVGPLKSS